MPPVVDALDWVEATVDTVNGEVAVTWEQTDELSLDVMVPWNADAAVRIPGATGDTTLLEDEVTVWDGTSEDDLSDGVTAVECDGNELVVDIGAGFYAFSLLP